MRSPGQSLHHITNRTLRSLTGRLREERGSALVLVMFIVLLLTILGLSVLTAAVGGAQRTETRKNDVQSLHLAEKTLDEAVAYITARLNKEVESSVDLSQDQLNAQIDAFLTSLSGSQNPLTASTDLEQASGDKAVGRIVKVTKAVNPANGTPPISGRPTSYTLTLSAQAEVNGIVRKLTRSMIIDTYPDFLNYTLGSENNLIINGSPYIDGNIYAGDTLRISDTAEYKYDLNDRTYVSTPFELNGEAHVQSLNKLEYKSHDSSAILTGNEVTDKHIVDAANIKIKNRRSFVEVNVESSFIDKVQEAIGPGADRKQIKNHVNGGLAGYLSSTYDAIFDHPVLPQKPDPADTSEEGEKAKQEYAEAYGKAVKLLTNPTKSLVYNGDLTIDGKDLSGINYTQKTSSGYPNPTHYWYIVDGNLTINNYGGDTPIDIRANMLVTGKVQIRGKVRFDSTIFTLKESAAPNGAEDFTTVIEDASIQGLNGKELVLISQGQILINRLAAFDNTEPAPLDAFFYTDSDAKLYGVGSIFSLRGGFFAKGNLTINAVRGTAVGRAEEIDIQPNNNLIRFKAVYNDQVFTHQQAGLPRVKTVNIRVGELKLE